MSGLSIGSLPLNPTFSPEVYSYTAETSNKTNAITAKSDDPAVTIGITLDNETKAGALIANGAAATWATGDNLVTITVTDEDGNAVDYVVTVVKS